ncbi:RnfH family protein [Candidatus Thiosymbion oneisti]|uniref:RnfH family protein n=1 Tax=Candidatus Thiosymbion oneisti TaxID=589554 RepID=UPI000AB80E77|nr:RnfH family protein [Candidatus Thiosymbion oneisti]
MNVGVAYADKFEKVWLKLEVPDGSTVQQAIEHSGLLTRFPQIDLDTQRVGIFGKLSKLTTKVAEGDRIEIYRPITADPETVERRDSE